MVLPRIYLEIIFDFKKRLTNVSFYYFCRFCNIMKTDFRSSPIALGTMRDELSYSELVSVVSENGADHSEGVKFNSPLNEIPRFHVTRCLPSCIGHDLFEGVVSYDLSLCLRQWISMGVVTIEYLNFKLATTLLGHSESLDKPPLFLGVPTSLPGHAVQN